MSIEGLGPYQQGIAYDIAKRLYSGKDIDEFHKILDQELLNRAVFLDECGDLY